MTKTVQPTNDNSDEQTKLAVRCVCAVTGCGKIPGLARVSAMKDETVEKLAKIEASGNRRPAITLLYSK